MPTTDVAAKLDTHEQICAFRYKTLEDHVGSVDSKVEGINASLQKLTWAIGGLLLTSIGYLLIHYVVK
jgi:hypothetical protein